MESGGEFVKNWLNGALATCLFELRRSFTIQRTAVSVVLAAFPPLMITLLLVGSRIAAANSRGDGQRAAVMMDAFVPFVIVFLVALICLLSLLLWATPNVYSELEGKSWSFVASRPGGRISLYLGKYLAAVIVSFLISFTATSISVLIAERICRIPDAMRLWLSLTIIFFLVSMAYGAVFSMIGTLFYKRGMIVAAGYLIASEFFLASVPALINKFTLRFHFQELGLQLVGFFFIPGNEEQYRAFFGQPWAWWCYVIVVVGITLLTLSIGGYIIANRQYILADES